jgi:hypothetical protein
MARKKRISTELSVGLTPEMEKLVFFASEITQIQPSIYGRIALSEKLTRDGVPQLAAQFFATQQQAK